MKVEIGSATLYLGDCLEVMATMPADSIDLTVTSPPYDNLRTYNGFTFDFEGIAREMYRVTKPGGVVVWVVGDATVKGSETGTSFRQALYFKDVCGFSLHDTMIWHKGNPTPQQQHPRYQPAFEYMFVLCKGYPPRAFNPLTQPNKRAGRVESTGGQRNADDSFRHGEKKGWEIAREGRKHNVWEFGVSQYRGHPAPFPEQLAADHIASWSNPGDVVLDPFLGSGTTGKMAILADRDFIGIEISNEYLDIARKRIEEAQRQRRLIA